MSEKLFVELSKLKPEAPQIFGIPTGTKLDEMFWVISEEKGEFIKKTSWWTSLPLCYKYNRNPRYG